MHTNFRTLLISLAAVLGFSLLAGASRPISADPKWKIHSSFDNLPRRIVDTPDAVYFFVHQRPYYPNGNFDGFYTVPTGAVFIREKANPDAPMTDLHQAATLSGSDVRTFTVNPTNGALLLTYTDGGIDFVAPDRKVTFYDNVQKRNYPGASTVNRVSYDKSRNIFWISTNSGYFAVSATDGSIIRETSWTLPVTDINSVGNLVVAIIDSKLCTAPYGSAIARQKSFTPIQGLSFNGNPIAVLPLSSRHFGFLTDKGVLYYATLTDGAWSCVSKMDHSSMLLPANDYIANRCESSVTPTRNGYMITPGSYAYLLGAPESEQGAPTFTKVTLPSGSNRYTASYNLTDYYFYRERGQFHTASLNGSTWSPFSEPFRPSAPLTSWAMEFKYSPKHGLVASNIQYGYSLSAGTIEPALIAVYRDGLWRDAAGSHHRPYYADENSTFADKWEANRKMYPVSDPRGFFLDPLFPDFAVMGSSETGAAIFNINDPKNYPILTTIPSEYVFSAFPTIKDFRKSGWGNMTMVAAAGADSDNNIWLVKANSWIDNTVDLMYMTPDDRRPLLEPERTPVNLIPETHWRKIPVQLPFNPSWAFNANIMTHPKNKGKFLFTCQGGSRNTFIFDHKNTLEDESDDVLRSYHLLKLPNGAVEGANIVSRYIENPANGDVYVICHNNVYIIDLDSEIVDESIPARHIKVRTPEGQEADVIQPLRSNTACFDEYGRLWIGTEYAGVIGIDPNTETLIAHYDTKNSPLPDNNVHGVGWNPDTKSLFISSNLGMAEVKVDTPDKVDNQFQQPFLMPAEVPTAYTGTVTVRNVPDGMSAAVVDADGRQITLLPLPVSGVTHWNLRDAEGHRVPAGLYRIIDPSASTSFPSLPLLIAD